MRRRAIVHHFILAELARPENPTWRVCDLFRVSHWRDVPSDTEFPYTITRLHAFARFYTTSAKPTDFRVRVWWLDHPSGHPEQFGDFGPFNVPFARNTAVRDWSFNLHNVRLQGVGLHHVQLVRERRKG